MQAAPEETTDAQDRADGEDETLKQADSSSILVSALVIVSRITGFFRTTMQAWALGATGVASAYTVANQMPNFLYELVVGGMLITSFLPVYINVKTKLGKKGAAVYASNLLTIVLVLMALLALISVALAAPIIWTQSAGASAGFDFDLSVWFFRWFAVSIVLYALSSIFSGVLNAERDYLWSNFAPVLNNLITIAMFVAYGYLVQDGADARGAAIVLAVGTPLAVAVQVFCQVPALRRHGLRLSLRVNLHDPALKDTLSIGLPTLVATLAAAPTTAIMSSCALSVTPAGASIAYYSRVWYVLPYSIFAIPITVTMFTELSSSFLAGRTDRFRDYVVEGTKKILFTLVPCAMLLIVFAEPLIAVFASGQFTDEDALLTAHYLQALSLALPLYALSSYVQKVCSSMMRMGLFAAATVVGSVLQVVICLWLTPVWGLYVVPVSSSFFYGAIDVVTLLQVRAKLGGLRMRSVFVSVARALALGALGCLVGVAILAALTHAFGPCRGVVRGLLYAAVGGFPALAVTFGGATLLGISDAPLFDALFSRLFRRLGLKKSE